MPRRSWSDRVSLGWSRPVRRSGAALVTIGLSAALLAGCGDGSDGADRGGGDGGGQAKKVPPASLTITPKTGATKLSPATPVVVKAAHGTLATVELTNGKGKHVKGSLSKDKTTWTSGEKLGYDKTYKVAATATNAKGKKATADGSFHTVKPGNFTMPYIQNQHRTYGVGEPVMVHFDEKIPNRAAAEKAMTVTTSPKLEGSWHWLNDQDVHWRPKTEAGQYWPANTKVTVDAEVYGVNMGKGLWGQQDKKVSFRIGAKHVAIASNKSLHMKVYENDKQVRDIPFSGGQGGYITDKYGNKISLWTPSGVMVVMTQEAKVHMTSASWNISDDNPMAYDSWVKWGTRLTYDGIYLHAAPWNMAKHGVSNDSHGCLNLSNTDAKWLYDNFQPGDIVIMKGTPDKVAVGRGYGDWNVSWDDWVSGSALH